MSESAAVPRPEPDPAADVATWVELRVHGVSGTPPESMLAVDERHICPVSSARRRGVFYQRSDGAGHPVGPDDDGRILEAYHWGEHTERDPGQALWVFLVPFGIVNAAQFMLPAEKDHAVAHAIAGAMLRVIALVVTGLAVVGVSFATMDALAWQIPAAGPGRLWWLLPAAAAPVLVLAWLRRIGTVTNPGARSLAESPGLGDDPPTEDEPPGGLGASYFYVGSPTTPSRTDAPTLRWLHLAVGTALVALLLSWPAASGAFGPAAVTRWCGGILLLLVVLTVVLLGDPEELASPPDVGVRLRAARLWWHGIVHRLAPIAFALTVVVLAAAVVVDVLAARSMAAADLRSTSLPGIDDVTFALVVTGGAAAVVMIGATFRLGGASAKSERERAFQRYLHGTAGALAASVGMFLAILYTGGFVTVFDLLVNIVRRWLDTSGPDPVGLTDLPRIVRHIAVATSATVVVSLVFGLVLVGRFLSLRRRLQDAAVRDVGRPEGSDPVELDPGVLRAVAKGMYLGRLKTLIPVVFVLYAATGLALTAAASVDLRGVSPWLDRLPHRDGWVVFGAVWLTAIAVAVAWIGWKGQERKPLRRTANTVWDVVSFWPRSIHPFVPVAYSQEVVADLRRRISHHVADGRSLVLAAHSQGSLISIAALLWIPPDERERVGVLTFGSQIRQMFARAFPAYVDTDVVAWVWKHYGKRWRSLYRDTDYLGGPVLSWDHRTVVGDGRSSARWPDAAVGPDDFARVTGTRACGPDWRLFDPRLSDGDGARVAPGPAAKLYRHSEYWTDPDWVRAVEAVTPGRSSAPAAGAPAPRCPT